MKLSFSFKKVSNADAGFPVTLEIREKPGNEFLVLHPGRIQGTTEKCLNSGKNQGVCLAMKEKCIHFVISSSNKFIGPSAMVTFQGILDGNKWNYLQWHFGNP